MKLSERFGRTDGRRYALHGQTTFDSGTEKEDCISNLSTLLLIAHYCPSQVLRLDLLHP